MIGACAACRICKENTSPVLIGHGDLSSDVLIIWPEREDVAPSSTAQRLYDMRMHEAAGAAVMAEQVQTIDSFNTVAVRCSDVPDGAIDFCSSYTRWLLSLEPDYVISCRDGLKQFAIELVAEADWSTHKTAFGVVCVMPDDADEATILATMDRLRKGNTQ